MRACVLERLTCDLVIQAITSSANSNMGYHPAVSFKCSTSSFRVCVAPSRCRTRVLDAKKKCSQHPTIKTGATAHIAALTHPDQTVRHIQTPVQPPQQTSSVQQNQDLSGQGTDSRPGPSEGSEAWYFAFGANMNWETLSRRDVKVLSRDPATVKDPSIRLVFKHRGGYASLAKLEPGHTPKYVPYNNQRVHGVLYKVSAEDLVKLQKREGGYVIQSTEVETYDGKVVLARVFVSGPLATLAAEVVPTEKYMHSLRDGAADNYLDPLYQAWLSGIETVSSAGLGAEYYDTPSKWISYIFLAMVAIIVAAFYTKH